MSPEKGTGVMADIKRTFERRKNKRFKAIEGAYAAISPNSQILGQIVDISMGGVCFKYIDPCDTDEAALAQQEDSIFLSSMGYYVGDLSFRIVSDYQVINTPSFSSMKVRKRHVQFFDLGFKQLFDLDHYLRNNVSEQLEKLVQ